MAYSTIINLLSQPQNAFRGLRQNIGELFGLKFEYQKLKTKPLGFTSLAKDDVV